MFKDKGTSLSTKLPFPKIYGNGFYFGSIDRCKETGGWTCFIHEELNDSKGRTKRLVKTYQSLRAAQRMILFIIRAWSSGSSLLYQIENPELWWANNLDERILERKYD